MLEYKAAYWKMMILFFRKSMNVRYGKETTKLLIQKAEVEYREMLNRFDDIGAGNPMASNAYMSLVTLSLWKSL